MTETMKNRIMIFGPKAAHRQGLFSCRAVDNIERLIPLPKTAMLRITDTEKLRGDRNGLKI